MYKGLISSEKGSALVLVLTFGAALLILGGALLAYSINDKHIANRQERSNKLYYITEAGLEAGIAVMSRSMNHLSLLSGEVGGGQYEVEFIMPPGLPLNHPYYQQVPQRIGSFSRIIISRGTLREESMVMAAIVELDDILTKALMVSSKLTLENSTVYGNLHTNDQFHIKGTNRVYGEFSYSDRQQFAGEGPNPTLIVVAPSAGDGTESKAYTFTRKEDLPESMRAPRIEIPPINFDLFHQDVDYIHQSNNQVKWDVYPYEGIYDRVRVNSDLEISPGNGETFNFNSNGLLVVEGNLNIKPHINGFVYLSGVIVVNGSISVAGNVNVGITNPGDNMLLLVGKNDVRVTKAEVDTAMFLGGYLLLFSEKNVHIGDSNLSEQLNLYGTIIAEHTELNKVSLHYVPDIFEEHGDKFGKGVVVGEWIQPWITH